MTIGYKIETFEEFEEALDADTFPFDWTHGPYQSKRYESEVVLVGENDPKSRHLSLYGQQCAQEYIDSVKDAQSKVRESLDMVRHYYFKGAPLHVLVSFLEDAVEEEKQFGDPVLTGPMLEFVRNEITKGKKNA
jgi:hypothetical protein